MLSDTLGMTLPYSALRGCSVYRVTISVKSNQGLFKLVLGAVASSVDPVYQMGIVGAKCPYSN